MTYSTDFIGKNVHVMIDRPLGTKHPKWGFKYETNYGYIPGTKAPDGEPIDAYVLGVNEPLEKFEGKCIAVIHRTNDDDDKIVIVKEGTTLTDEEIKKETEFQEKFFKSEVIRLDDYEKQKEETLESYEKNTEELAEYFATNARHVVDREIFIERMQGKKILDLGCGSGDHTKYFNEKGFEAVGIDFSPNMVELTRKQGVKAEVMDMENMTFLSNEFDGVWAAASILHLPKGRVHNVAKQIARIMKTNGLLYVSVKKGENEGMRPEKFDENFSRFFSEWTEEDLIQRFCPPFKHIDTKYTEAENKKFIGCFFKLEAK